MKKFRAFSSVSSVLSQFSSFFVSLQTLLPLFTNNKNTYITNMEFENYDFTMEDAEASHTYPQKAGQIRRNGFVVFLSKL